MARKLRVATLETLFTANVDDVDKAEKHIKVVGQRVESKTVVQKVGADENDALAGMRRVEAEAKKLVSERAVLKLDTDITRTETNLQRATERLEDLQVRAEGGLDVGADVRRAEANIQRLERSLAGLRSAREVVDVEADVKPALDALADVEREKRVVSQATAVRVNAEVSAAERNLAGLQQNLDYLRALAPSVKVDADIATAERKLEVARAVLRDLDGARAEMQVDVNEGGARQKLSDVADYAGQAGKEGGDDAGANLATGIVAALATIPIAGAVIGVGKAAGEALLGAIQEGLAIDQRGDRLEALTGLTPEQAGRIGRGAGEAYANVFGESIEANMNTARVGVQFGIIDRDATTRDAQQVIEGLSGIADILGEDVRPVATAVTTLLRTGLAPSARDAFDLIAAGEREGVNRGDDLLDTLTEYPTLFRSLGLSGQEAIGLVNQGLAAGARNSDFVADALKEVQVQMRDAGETATARNGLKLLGLDVEDMYARFAEGGPRAREGLEMILTGMREIEDPTVRNQVALDLFKTKAEDLGDALYALDLTTAVDSLNGVQGAAQRMFDTLADNDATKLEGAKRNVETAMAGIQGALAAALSDPIEDAATFISENRGPVLQFFVDLANGALDFAETASDSWGDFVSGPLRETLQGLRDFIEWLPGDADLTGLDSAIDGMSRVEETTDAMSDKIAQARDELNKFADPQLDLAYLHDASFRLAGAIDQVGTSATVGRSMLDDYSEAQDGSARISGELSTQVWAAVEAMNAEQQAASDAGEEQDNLNDRWTAGRDALIGQLEQMGIVPEKAQAIVDAYDRIPPTKTTTITADTAPAEASIAWLTNPDRFKLNIPVFAQAAGGQAGWGVRTDGGGSGRRPGGGSFGVSEQANGSVLEFMANGGLTPMAPLAQMVPPSTWRVVGDRSDVSELYAPLDGSPRSWALLLEGLRQMPGVMPMANGGIVSAMPAAVGAGRAVPDVRSVFNLIGSGIEPAEAESIFREMLREFFASVFGR